jgi:hypothetical protein
MIWYYVKATFMLSIGWLSYGRHGLFGNRITMSGPNGDSIHGLVTSDSGSKLVVLLDDCAVLKLERE